MIRVVLPAHLRTLARVPGEVELPVAGPVTQRAVLDALEARFPMLCGTIRDQRSGKRRAFVRFFACQQDLSHEPPDQPLPERGRRRDGAVPDRRGDGGRLSDFGRPSSALPPAGPAAPVQSGRATRRPGPRPSSRHGCPLTITRRGQPGRGIIGHSSWPSCPGPDAVSSAVSPERASVTSVVPRCPCTSTRAASAPQTSTARDSGSAAALVTGPGSTGSRGAEPDEKRRLLRWPPQPVPPAAGPHGPRGVIDPVPVGQVDVLLPVGGGDRRDEQIPAEQVLPVGIAGGPVGRVRRDHRPDQRAALLDRFDRAGVQVGQQPVSRRHDVPGGRVRLRALVPG